MSTVLLPIPTRDFDPTEVAVSWRVLHDLGHDVVFATPDGQPGAADDIMVTGRGLPLVGKMLRADARGRTAYRDVQADKRYRSPVRWADLDASAYDGLLLPGGHRARGMHEYLESAVLQRVVVAFFGANKPVGAVCHGVLLAARSIDPGTGRSVLYGRKTTALTLRLERTAWRIGRVVRFWDPEYYRTYPDPVQVEVTRHLEQAEDFLDVPRNAPDYRRKTNGLARDTIDDERPAWVVTDGNYVSARWPGDVHTFAKTFAGVLTATHSSHAG